MSARHPAVTYTSKPPITHTGRVIGATPVDHSQYAIELARSEACANHDQLTDWLGAMSMDQTFAAPSRKGLTLDELSVPDLLVSLMECDDKALPLVRMTLRDRYLEAHASEIDKRAHEIETNLSAEDLQ